MTSNQVDPLGGLSALLDRHVFSLSTGEATVGMILAAILVLIVSFALAWAVKRVTIRHFKRHGAGDAVAVGTLANILAVVVLLVGLDIVLHIFGLGLTSLFAAGGIFALGAGFAAKETIENYLSGVILRLDKTIRQGDVVEVQETLMTIERIGLRSTSGKTGDGVSILVPNSTVAEAIVKNLTREDNLVRVTARVGVALDSDRHTVRQALERVAANWEHGSAGQDSQVILEEFTARSIVYSVIVWTDDVALMKQSKSELQEAIWRELEAAGVTLA